MTDRYRELNSLLLLHNSLTPTILQMLNYPSVLLAGRFVFGVMLKAPIKYK